MTDTTDDMRLELLADQIGLANLLDQLADICAEKAEHVANNWQDATLAAEWRRAGAVLATASTAVAEILGR